MNINIFETKSSFYPKIMIFWIINILVIIAIFFYSIFELPLFLGISYIIIAFYLIFIKFFQYKLYRFFYKIEFNDDNQIITFHYRDNLFKKGKSELPYNAILLWKRKTILSSSVFIRDKRKSKPFNYLGVINKEYFFGKKYWNNELYNLVTTKLNSIVTLSNREVPVSQKF